jgi:hypothetical protein
MDLACLPFFLSLRDLACLCLLVVVASPFPGFYANIIRLCALNLLNASVIQHAVSFSVKFSCTVSCISIRHRMPSAKYDGLSLKAPAHAALGGGGRETEEREEGEHAGGPHFFSVIKNVITHKPKHQIKFRLHH